MKLVILDRDGTINAGSRRLRQVARGMGGVARRARGDRPAQPRRLAHGDRHQPVGPGPRPVRHGRAQRHPRAHEPRAGGARRPHRRGVLLPARPRRRLPLPQAAAGPVRDDRRALRRRRSATRTSSAIRCATCRPAPRRAAQRIWCAPARARHSTHARSRRCCRRCPARACTPTSPPSPHALIHDERRERGIADDEADSLFGKLA